MFEQTGYLAQLLGSNCKKLVLIDYDGALVASRNRQEMALLDLKVIEMLLILSARKDIRLVIMTGRSRSSIDSLIGQLGLDIIAEHGAFCKQKGVWRKLVEEDVKWKRMIFPILAEYTSKCPGAILEEKEYSLCLDYGGCRENDGTHLSFQLTQDLELYLKKFNLRVLEEKRTIEFLPAKLNKGRAAQLLMCEDKFEHIFTIGNGLTDEEILQALYPVKQYHTNRVGTA